MMAVQLLSVACLCIIIPSISATIYTCDPTLVCGCSAASAVVTARIVGGEAALNHTWGWMASLRVNGQHLCGASLLSTRHAVTAAHCFDDVSSDVSALSIVVGTNYLNDTSGSTVQRRTVTKVITHPNYISSTSINDISIIEFSPLTISPNSKLTIICLPNKNQDPVQINGNLVAIGWGAEYEDSEYLSNSLQQVTVQAYPSASASCRQSEIVDPLIQLCAGISTGGKDTCQGDSGGPLMAFVNNRWILAGITSSGVGCAQAGYLGVYTRVSAFVSFIESNVNASIFVSTTASTTSSTRESSSLKTTVSTRSTTSRSTSPRTTISVATSTSRTYSSTKTSLVTTTTKRTTSTRSYSGGNGFNNKDKYILIFAVSFSYFMLH